MRGTTTLVHTESLRAWTLFNDSYDAELHREGWTEPSFARATPLTAQRQDAGLVLASVVGNLRRHCAIISSVKTWERRRGATRGRGASPPLAGASRGQLPPLQMFCPTRGGVCVVASLLVRCGGVLTYTRYAFVFAHEGNEAKGKKCPKNPLITRKKPRPAGSIPTCRSNI